jgi:pyruvate dehydrogenase (quinone)
LNIRNLFCGNLADAAGIVGLRVERPEQAKPVLNQALEHNGPALVDVVVNPQELFIPPTINLEQIRGL